MQQLSGALEELDHAFGGAAYASRRAHVPALPRPAVPYDGLEPTLHVPVAQPAAARPQFPAKRAPTERKRGAERALPRWVDLDDAAAIQDSASLLGARKKPRAGALGPAAEAVLGADGAAGSAPGPAAADADEPAAFEQLLQKHVQSQRKRERRASAAMDDAEPAPNQTPAGEPIDAATRNIARLVAARLEETMSDARRTIERTLALLGTEKVLELLERAEATDSSGGLLTSDGTKRRRTRGGIFFYFVKQMTNKKEKAYLWPASGGGAAEAPVAADSRLRGGGARGGAPARGRGRGRRPNQELLLGSGALWA